MDARLVAAEAPGHHQPAEARFAQRRDGRVRKPAKRIGEIRVLFEKRAKSRRSALELARIRHCGFRAVVNHTTGCRAPLYTQFFNFPD
jgi:hypothetical protein